VINLTNTNAKVYTDQSLHPHPFSFHVRWDRDGETKIHSFAATSKEEMQEWMDDIINSIVETGEPPEKQSAILKRIANKGNWSLVKQESNNQVDIFGENKVILLFIYSFYLFIYFNI